MWSGCWLLRAERKQKLDHPLSREALRRKVEDTFLAQTDIDVCNWADPIARAFQTTVVTTAERYVLGFKLALHAHEASKSKGHAAQTSTQPENADVFLENSFPLRLFNL